MGVFSFHELKLKNLHLESAVRYESTAYDVNEPTRLGREFQTWSGSVSGDLDLMEALRFGLTVFRTERAPSTEALYSRGPHLATGQYELGDDRLEEETALGLEAALRYKSGERFITVNGFYTDYDNYISAREENQQIDDLPVFVFRGSDAKFYGFEAHAGAPLFRWWGFDIGVEALAEYVRARAVAEDLPRIPPFGFLMGLKGVGTHTGWRLEVDYQAAQNKIAPFELASDDFAFVNAFLDWKVMVTRIPVRVSLSVLNLFDAEGRQHSSFLKDRVPLPGRNFRLSMNVTF